MQSEIEATFLDINKEQLRKKLKALGAELLLPETLMRRTVFAIDQNSYVRVRDEGNRITMSYKHLNELSLSGMKEICLEVSDYQTAIDFLKACGLKPKSEQETYREEWRLGKVELDIDTWPWIPSFIEIEGASEAEVVKAANQLGYEMADALYGAVDQVYKVYYDVQNDDINLCPEIKFTDPPKWLTDQCRRQPLHP